MLHAIKKILHMDAGDDEPRPEVICLCCGDCCEFFGGHLEASQHDRDRWQREGRVDLLSMVNRLGWIWVHPESKELYDRCPFIDLQSDGRRFCAIQETKPDICRDYPTLAHGKKCLHGVFLK